ncbi:myb-related transcription factor, partner of profilin-like [Pantherophis guttatus]|uniref:Myb-related transcription factor, partner of profilin-like n=1 Tax=Pantherophis guttatus TaxID=94885 RepID=A0ABM3YQC4_PANGU|nr:myb-related transcription factor, partner of profilin-like [Pantherophis guttatus]
MAVELLEEPGDVRPETEDAGNPSASPAPRHSPPTPSSPAVHLAAAGDHLSHILGDQLRASAQVQLCQLWHQQQVQHRSSHAPLDPQEVDQLLHQPLSRRPSAPPSPSPQPLSRPSRSPPAPLSRLTQVVEGPQQVSEALLVQGALGVVFGPEHLHVGGHVLQAERPQRPSRLPLRHPCGRPEAPSDRRDGATPAAPGRFRPPGGARRKCRRSHPRLRPRGVLTRAARGA